jgi:hypothetical protein
MAQIVKSQRLEVPSGLEAKGVALADTADSRAVIEPGHPVVGWRGRGCILKAVHGRQKIVESPARIENMSLRKVNGARLY